MAIWSSGVAYAPWTRTVPLPSAPPGRRRRTPLLAAAAVLVAGLGLAVGLRAGPAPAPAAIAAPVDVCAPSWVTGWQAAPQPAPAPAGLAGSTLRMIVHPQVTGTQVRMRLSNAYGATPLVISAVSAARSDGTSGLVPQPVAFAGLAGVTVPAGGQVFSDPVPTVAEVGVPLAVSLDVVTAPQVATMHAVALQTSYVAHAPVDSWFFLTGVDVLAPRPENAVVAIGDSITDGVGSGADTNERWSDALATRLTAAGGATDMAVLNAGISRNELLTGSAEGGDSVLRRFDRDVAGAAGATDVVVHVGTNDIAAGRGADAIIDGMKQVAERAHSDGRRVFLTTITPSTNGAHRTPAATAVREEVNDWVLARGPDYADGVFDFAVAVADPVHPTRLAPVFDSGDGLHLSPAGYRVLAGAVDLLGLTGSPCLADTSPARVVLSGS